MIELKLDGGVHLSKNVSHQHLTHDVIRALKFLSVPQPFTYPKQTKPHILGFHRHATEYIHPDEKEICFIQVNFSSSCSNLEDHIKTHQLMTPIRITMSKQAEENRKGEILYSRLLAPHLHSCSVRKCPMFFLTFGMDLEHKNMCY